MKKTTKPTKTFSINDLVRISDLTKVIGGTGYDPANRKEIVGK